MYKNDTVEFYISGDNSKDTSYGPNACHFDVVNTGATGPGSQCNLTGTTKGAAQVVPSKG